VSRVPDLSARARRVLRDAIASDAMPVAAKQRVLDRLESAPPAPDRRFWFTTGVAMAAAFTLVVALRMFGGTLVTKREQAGSDSAVDLATPEETRGSTTPRTHASDPKPAPPSGDAVQEAPPSATEPSLPKSRESIAPPALREPSTLSEERVAIERAWANLGRGAWTQALELADGHARRFGNGALTPEREAIRAIARCKLGHPEANAQAERFLAHPHASALAPQVRAACKKAGSGTLEPYEHGHSSP